MEWNNFLVSFTRTLRRQWLAAKGARYVLGQTQRHLSFVPYALGLN
jgi:hypothetical protein